ncbi:HAAS signaling domain-containing protein [Streptomyces sp. NPDC047917]|uniref:HAAS signaling domain-containing protein n=1 Tax=Streptomyces sp. NPDC047917 TaxID=3365491 RepID=UPI00371504B2
MNTEKPQSAASTGSSAGGAGDALIRDYLAAVGREASALPPDRRQELVADLAEHIEVALAERPDSGREILRELGDPRDIAATALQESGIAPGPAPGTTAFPASGPVPAPGPAPVSGKAPARRSPVWLVVLLPVLAFGLGYLWVPLGFALKVTGAVVLFRSRYWTPSQKWTGFALTALAPSLMNAAWFFFSYPNDPPQSAYWTAIVATAVVTLAGAAWLWREHERDQQRETERERDGAVA